MEITQNEFHKFKKARYKTFLKGQEILIRKSIELDYETYKPYTEIYQPKTSPNLILKISNKKNYQTRIKNLYKKYKKSLIFSKQILKNLNHFKFQRFNQSKNFLKYNDKNIKSEKFKLQSYLSKLFTYKLSLIYTFKNKIRKLHNFNKKLNSNLFISTRFLKRILKFEKYLLYYFRVLKKEYKNNIVFPFTWLKNKNNLNIDSKSIARLNSQINKFIENGKFFFNSFEKKKLIVYLERIGFLFKVYFLPFIFLANQALIPFIQEYEELIINTFSSKIFERIPFLIAIIKLFNPIINSFNKMFQFWILIAYFLIFPLGYKSLKLSYKLGYNGSIALIFLLINSSLNFSQEIVIAIFESLKMIKDIVFSYFLIDRVKNMDEAFLFFITLVERYEIQVRQDYFNWLLFLNHYVLSPLAFISLAVLVYNCLYYVIYNKNPRIPLITKAALATIKNPQEEE